MNLIEAYDLTKRFGEVTAVDSVDLQVKRGEVVGFLGPNGAGKTTTMRMLAGFLDPDEGRASICGHDVNSQSIEAKRRLGYLPEGAPAYEDMTVADFMEFVGRMRGLDGPALNDRLVDMVENINLTDVWSKPVDTLSKGFKRRVGIAQALVHDPDVLILDEPTDGLDPNQKHEMRELIKRIAADKAIIVSTHILEEVEAVCSRAVIIAEGKVVADETPSGLMAKDTQDRAIRVTIASTGDDDELARLESVTGAGGVELLERVNGSTSVLIHPADKTAEPAQLVADLTKAKFTVEEVGRHRPRLEDVFRNITQAARD